MEIKQTLYASMNTNILRETLIRVLIGLIILPSSMCYALPAEFPTEFSATYALESYGIIVAKATYKLEHESNSLKFTQHSEPIGLVSFFKKVTLQETSRLSLHSDQLLLDKYSYIQKGSDKNRDISLKIDWIVSDTKLHGSIHGTARGNPVELKVNNPVWDTLSFQIPLMTNTNENNQDWNASLLVKGQLKKYSFITHGVEEISVNGNTLKTIKVERKDKSSNKPIFFWIAPELFNLPVKIEKWKKGKISITMQLDAATFPSHKEIQFKSIENFDDL